VPSLDELAATVLAAPARLRGSRLVCIDGRAGAGKTSLAAELAEACAAAEPALGASVVIHMDDLYAGWSGLPGVAEEVTRQLVDPWVAGEPGQLAVWDWHGHVRLEPVPVPLPPLVVLEGVGSWSRDYDDVVSTLVWLDCDAEVRQRRALERDGGLFVVHWDAWAADEERVHTREQTRLNADVVLDTTDQPVGP
jgi:uridine kinase